MLTLRRRGKGGDWFICGTVACGGREFSKGKSDRDAAEHLRASRAQPMFGTRAVAARATVSDALGKYLSKPKRPNSYDVLRISKLNEGVGDRVLSALAA